MSGQREVIELRRLAQDTTAKARGHQSFLAARMAIVMGSFRMYEKAEESIITKIGVYGDEVLRR